MKERFITKTDLVYWVELDCFIGDMPVYKVESGWYLGSYKFGSDTKHIVTSSITSCVVRHVDQYYTNETVAKFAADERTCYASKRNN
jgi:hypothetical protein